VVHQRLDDQIVQNTLYFELPAGAPSALQLADLATGVGDYWGLNMLPLQAAELTLEFVSARDLTFVDGLVAESISGQGPGGNANGFEPANVAACIKFITGRAGRSFRGRNYFGGIPTDVITGNHFVGGFLVSLAAAYAGMVGLGTLAAGWQWVVVSRFSGGLPRAEGIKTVVTDAFSTDDVADSQRRRLPGRGR